MSYRGLFVAVNTVLRNRVCPKVLTNNFIAQYVSTETENDAAKPKKKPKTAPVPKITLISNENVTITTLEDATKLSKRRDLKLVKLVDVDTKTQRPVYKLMTGTEYHQEDLKQREQRKKEKENDNSLKGEKVVMISAGISEHDLMVYVNKIIKWLAKRYEVRFVINSNSNMDKAEQVYKFLEDKLKDNARILQKRVKGSEIKFQMIPPKKEKEKEGAS